MNAIKNEVLVRAYVVFFLLLVAAGGVAYRTFQISVLEGDKWRAMGEKLYRRFVKLEAERGNILTEKSDLLATSLPYFDLAFDPNSSGMRQEDWDRYIDTLAYCLATYLDPSYTPGGWKYFLEEKRRDSSQYVPLKKNATLAEKEMVEQFPLFNLGQFRGGLIVQRKYRRQRPFGILANRTIGYVRGDSILVGLEGYFDEQLRGKSGLQLVTRVSKDVWLPVNDWAIVDPEAGMDVVTTIDVDLQAIVEEALAEALRKHQAKWGTAILMEVETGAIRAIANLSWWRDGELWETYNYAVGTATEPGSTFKLASIMALLEDGLVQLEDSIDLEQGRTEFYEETLEDASYHGLDSTTVRKAFELSSNVGMAKLIQQNYGETNRPEKFIKRLKQFHLDDPTGIQIPGEAQPFIKEPFNAQNQWSGTTLPWMAIGYEVLLTPLQMLTFYNAVANDGYLMKPYLVSELQHFNKTVKRFPPVRLKKPIASSKTIAQAKSLLEGVVLRGTAAKYQSPNYSFAGKTGTAQIGYQRLKDRTLVSGYQASFAGYFPAEKPRYSCIVVIAEPKEGGYYGSSVALPVFRRIADRIFDTRPEMFPALNARPKPLLARRQLPDLDAGHRQDLQTALSYLGLPFVNRAATDFAVLRPDRQSDSLLLLQRTLPDDRVPSVVGMGLRDALFILENRGLKVEIEGAGRVRRQSIKPGTKVNGQTIRLYLG